MVYVSVPIGTLREDKLVPYFRQQESATLLDSAGFYKRVCEALGIDPGRGAKAKIAKIVGITKTTAGSWEQGEMPGARSLQSLESISKLSNASLHWLLTGKGPKEVIETSTASAVKIEPRESEVSPEIRQAIRKELAFLVGGLTSDLSAADRDAVDDLVGKIKPESKTNKKKK